MPRVDLILCRDCLVHLQLPAALHPLRNMVGSGSKYFATATYPGLVRRNENRVITGNWRPLDLQAPPFSLRTPIRVITEGCTEADNQRRDSACGTSGIFTSRPECCCTEPRRKDHDWSSLCSRTQVITSFAQSARKTSIIAFGPSLAPRAKLSFVSASAAMPEPVGFSWEFFRHVASHRRIYNLIVTRRTELTIVRRIPRMLDERIRDDLLRRSEARRGSKALKIAVSSRMAHYGP